MKKYLLILSISIFSLVANGQNFVYPANQWNVSGSENFGGTYTEIFRVFGDSVIGNMSYNKIFISYDSTMTNWSYYGLLREDSNKVYFIPQYGNTEGLLYDFSLNAGDTTHIISAWMPEPQEFICQSVDSIIYNGTFYKRWNFSFPDEQWIEGIGSTEGPLHSGASAYVFDLWFSLLCFHRNDSLLYMQPNITQCYYSTVGIKELDVASNINLSPNPLQRGQSLKICSDYSIISVELYNSVGLKLGELLNIENKTAVISTGNMTTGIYLAKITTRENLTFIKKVCIK